MIKKANDYYSAFSHSYDQVQGTKTIMMSASSTMNPTIIAVSTGIVVTKQTLDFVSMTIDSIDAGVNYYRKYKQGKK